MKTMILDDFPHWPIYLVAIVCLASFIAAVVALIRRRRMALQIPAELRPMARRPGASVFYVVMAGIASCFFVTSMFFRFHAVSIGPDRVELVYFWPRPVARIEMAALERVEVVPYRKRGGYMQIATHDGVFRSVDFRQMTVAAEIRAALTEQAAPQR